MMIQNFGQSPNCNHSFNTSYGRKCIKCKEFRMEQLEVSRQRMLKDGKCFCIACPFSPNNQPERLSEKTSKEDAIV